MKILKASAGSGKTYSLSHSYIDQLLKAGTADAYRHILAVTFTNKATAEMKKRILKDLKDKSSGDSKSYMMLVRMLHDYGAFAVSTIDRFFQQTLKAFSREVGQFADYQIELDRDALINEAMDRILDSLSPEKEDLLAWIKESVRGLLEQSSSPKIEDSLYATGALLKSEEHRELQESLCIDDKEEYSKERLAELRVACNEIIDGIAEKLKGLGVDVVPGAPLELAGKKRKFKDKPEILEYICEVMPRYNTAMTVRDLIFSLGLAGEFYAAFDSLLKEKNLMCLDESNVILKDIINGSDAPFVYEKIGVRYENFLLDEFQDTSKIQWENFLPLLKESEAGGGDNLIVGDVKQSIYRFRGSDWELLGYKVPEQFPSADIGVLDGNWRSAETIVNFNSAFFSMAASRLGLTDLYSDVRQTPKISGTGPGSVQVSFCEDQDAKLLESIDSVRAAGAEWGDIAILVRGRAQGSHIAELLVGKGIPVISDDSLNLKSSVVIRRLVALLNAYDNPEDSISRFLADTMNITFPGNYHSLVDFSESLLRALKEYDPVSFGGETLFIQAFMDDLQKWTNIYGNTLRAYLKHWNEANMSIGSPENGSALRIITVHKSKGLEFPYVIFPYADKVELFKSDVRWCRLDAGANGLPEVFDGIYPVLLSRKTADTYFADSYEEERSRQLVDNLNIFYVALTRAGKGLHVIAGTPTGKFRESLKKGKPDYGRVSDLLYEFVGGFDERSYGRIYDFSAMKREQSREIGFPAEYESISLAGRLAPSADAEDFFADEGVAGFEASARLRGVVLHEILSSVRVASDLDRAIDRAVTDGSIGAAHRERIRKMLAERISAHPEWFPEEKGAVILNERTVFDRQGRENRPDRVVIAPEGARIVDFKFGKKSDAHVRQVQRYAGLYESIGYKVLSGAVWYVESDETVLI